MSFNQQTVSRLGVANRPGDYDAKTFMAKGRRAKDRNEQMFAINGYTVV